MEIHSSQPTEKQTRLDEDDIIISSLPKGRSLVSQFFNSLGFQPSYSYPHMSHLIHVCLAHPGHHYANRDPGPPPAAPIA